MTEFAVGDRVVVNETYPYGDDDDGLVGKTGTVTHVPEYGGLIDVDIPGKNGALGFYADELTKVVKRRLTIRPKDATTAAQFSGDLDLVGPEAIAADAVIIEGDFDFEVEDVDTTTYVQVKTGLYSRLTYIDPTGDLAVGDEVIVPLGYSDKEKYGEVVALGRGDYGGPCKAVVAKLTRSAL